GCRAGGAVGARAGAAAGTGVLVRVPPQHLPDAAYPLPAAGDLPVQLPAPGAHHAVVAGQADDSCALTSSSSIGRAFVCAMTGRKFESPPQRGTTCWCRWAWTPAPAPPPWFMLMLKPCGCDVAWRAARAALVSAVN